MFIQDGTVLKRFYRDKRIWQLVPGIERTSGGRLFATFYSGRCTETLGNYCVVVMSDDDGKNWSEPICAAYGGQMRRCFDSVLWLDPLGRLWFTWASGHRYGVYGVICENPDASELVWSEEFYIGEGVMMNKPTVLSTGEWLFPIAIWDYWYTADTFNQIKWYGDLFLEEYTAAQEAHSGANVYCSTDNGKTIRYLGSSHRIAKRSHDEHMIYEKKDGTLVMLTRTEYGISRSYSYDKGKAWTVAEPSGLTGPNSRFHIRRLKSGRLLLVNHDNFNGRNNLTAFLSEDDGESWPYKLLLDERSEVSYPDMAEGENGYLYIVYDRERGAYKDSAEQALSCAREILFAKINENDILNGSLTSKEGSLKNIVSKLGDYHGDEADLYTGRPPKVSPDEFVEYTMALKNREDILKYVLVYYPVSFSEITGEDAKRIDDLIDRVSAVLTRESELRETLTELTEFLFTLPLSFDKTHGAAFVSALLKYIRENATRVIDLKSFAYENRVSVNYLCHFFLKMTGKTVWEYREIFRFSEAKRMLISTEKTVEEIAVECGFDDSISFGSEFFECEGVTPIQYRVYNEQRGEK